MESDDKNLAKRSFKAASWVLIFQFASQGIQLLLGICMARLLSPEDYGVLGMLAIFWALSNVFINAGFSQALIQRKGITETDLSSVFYYNMFLAFLCCGIMLVSAPWIAEFYHQPILRQTIMVSAWTLPIGALSSVQRVLLSRDLKQGFITASQLIAIPISGVVAIYLAWRGYGVWALVWQTFVSTACGTILICLFVRWTPKLLFSLKALGSLFRFGSRLLLAGIIGSFFSNLSKVVIGKFYPAQTLGYYEQAQRYSSILPTSIQEAIGTVLFPAFSKIQDDLPRLKAGFKRALCVSVLVVVFPAYLLCTLSHPFIELVFTTKWLPCVPIWWLLTCSIVLWPIHVLNLQLLNVRGRSDRFLKLEIFKRCLELVSVAVLIFFGLYPMLIFGIFSSLISAYLNSYYSGKEINYGLLRQLRDVAIYAVLAALACFGAWGFYRLVYPWAHWIGFIGGACVGCVLYVALNFWFKTSAFFDLLEIVGKSLPFIPKVVQNLKLKKYHCGELAKVTPQKISNKTPRSSNIELLRIVAMLLIVMHHYVVNSGLNDVIYANPNLTCWRSLFLLVCGAWGKFGIDCFVLITGYYMCCSHITTRKFVKLVGAWLLYNWIFYFIFLCSGYQPFELKSFIKTLIPFMDITENFVPCYIFFFLFLPFLNILVHNINEKQHIRLILLSCTMYVFLASIPKFRLGMNYVSCFIVLYFLSSYVRLYPKKIFDNTRFWGFCTLFTVVLSIASVSGISWISGLLLGKIYAPHFYLDHPNKFLAVSTAFSTFMYFKNLKIKYNPLINVVAASTFGVLLIHANSDAMRQWLWYDMLDVAGQYSSSCMPLHLIGCVVGVFVICVLIDQIRIALIEKPFFRLYDAHWDSIKSHWERFDVMIWKKLNIEVKE